MRNLLEYPITHAEVIDYLNTGLEIEIALSDLGPRFGNTDLLCAKIALKVVKAASTIVQNDIGSNAAELLAEAFNSTHICQPVAEAELME